MHQILIDTLKKHKYFYKEFLINSLQFGIPNSRLRYYLVAKSLPFKENSNQILYDIPSNVKNLFNKEKYTLNEYLESEDSTKTKKHILEFPFLMKYRHVIDIVEPSDDHSCCFTKGYGRLYNGAGSYLCIDYTNKLKRLLKREDPPLTDDEIEDLQSNYGTLYYVRYFTPKEILRLLGFPENYSLPLELSRKQCYSLLGNSVNVKVVSAMFFMLFNS